MTVNWKEILDSKPEEAKKPEPLPPGTYLAVIEGHEFGESAQKKTPYVRYKLKLIAPREDVDRDAFLTYGGNEKLAKSTRDYDFYMSDDARYRHTEFLQNACKINTTGRGWAECIEETRGKQLIVQVSQEIEKRPPTAAANWEPRVFARITDATAAD